MKMGLIGTILITLIGIVMCNVLLITGSSKTKRFADIKVAEWWMNNQINFVFSFVLVMILFCVGWKYETLTVERAFMLGLAGQIALHKIIAAISKVGS